MARSAYTTVVLVALAGPAARAQDVAFPVTPAVTAFAGDAPAVTREYESHYTVNGPGSANERVRLVTTVLAPAGRESAGRLDVHHDEFRRIRELDGILRDASGRVVRRLGRDDVEDFPAVTGSFYDDLRVRTAELYGASYPFTVEWNYEVEHRGVLGWPAWYPQPGGHPAERAAFVLNVPAGTPVRYRAQRLEAEPTVTHAHERESYSWAVVRRPAFAVEPLGPSWQEQAAALFLGTTRFQIGNSAGSMDTWEDFGSWYAALSAGRTTLPEAARAEVSRIVNGADGDRERVRRLYDHLQRTTRYVSIQLGLGGWQPASARDVYERGYGDCKALSNYLIALLAEAGVRAYPALIRAGHNTRPVDSTFTANVFNHVIVHVPLEDGPVWLEATSTTAAFGRLGPFTEDRLALVVTESGGRLAPTPFARPDDNRSARAADVRLDASGSADVRARWALVGEPRDRAVHALGGRLPTEREAWFRSATGMSGGSLTGYDVSDVEHPAAEVILSAQWTSPRLAARAGTRLLFSPHLLAPPPPLPDPVDERTQPVHIGPPVVEVDTVRISLPDGYIVEAMPSTRTLETAFGRYQRETAVTPDGRTLVYIRSLEMVTARLPPEAYEEVRAFYAGVARADAERVALVRATTAASGGPP